MSDNNVPFAAMQFNQQVGKSRDLSTLNLQETAEFLWQLLDDIDTADDLAKGNDKLYRNLVRSAHKKRFTVGTTDGYTLELDCNLQSKK